MTLLESEAAQFISSYLYNSLKLRLHAVTEKNNVFLTSIYYTPLVRSLTQSHTTSTEEVRVGYKQQQIKLCI